MNYQLKDAELLPKSHTLSTRLTLMKSILHFNAEATLSHTFQVFRLNC